MVSVGEILFNLLIVWWDAVISLSAVIYNPRTVSLSANKHSPNPGNSLQSEYWS